MAVPLGREVEQQRHAVASVVKVNVLHVVHVKFVLIDKHRKSVFLVACKKRTHGVSRMSRMSISDRHVLVHTRAFERVDVVRRVESASERGLVLAIEPILLQAHDVAALAVNRADERVCAREERCTVAALDTATVAEVARRQHVERHERERARSVREPRLQQHRVPARACLGTDDDDDDDDAGRSRHLRGETGSE